MSCMANCVNQEDKRAKNIKSDCQGAKFSYCMCVIRNIKVPQRFTKLRVLPITGRTPPINSQHWLHSNELQYSLHRTAIQLHRTAAQVMQEGQWQISGLQELVMAFFSLHLFAIKHIQSLQNRGLLLREERRQMCFIACNFQDCFVKKIQVTGQSLLFSSQTQCSDVNQCPRPWLASLFIQVIENPHLQKTGVPSYQKYYQFIFPSLSSRKLIFPVLSGTSLGRCQLVSPFSFAKPGHSKLLEMAKSILFRRKPINFPNQISSRI